MKPGASFNVILISLFMALGRKTSYASKASQLPTPRDASLLKHYEIISSEIVESSDGKYHQNASPQCWKDVISSLKDSSRYVTSYDSDHAISPATHFCAGMNQLQRETMAIGLTACHVNRSTQFIPDTCLTSEVASGMNETAVKTCLSNLRESNDYMVYTQFYLYTEQACSNLTMELSIRQKNEAVRKLEQNAMEMKQFQSGLAEFQFKQESAMESIMKVAEVNQEHQNEIMTKMTKQGDASLALLQENKMTMLDLQQSTLSKQENIILEMKEMYEGSGLEDIKNIIDKLKQHPASTFGWNLSSSWRTLFKYGRFLTIFVGLLSTFTSRRFHSTRFYIILFSILEFCLEHILSTMVKSGQLEPSHHDFYVAFLRSYDIPMYTILLILSYLSSFVFGTRATETGTATDEVGKDQNNTGPVQNDQMSITTLEIIQNELRMDREAHRRAQHRVNEELLLLRRHIANQNTSNSQQRQSFEFTTPVIPRPSLDVNLPPPRPTRMLHPHVPFSSPPPLYLNADTPNQHSTAYHTPITSNGSSYQTPVHTPIAPRSNSLTVPGAPMRASSAARPMMDDYNMGNNRETGAFVSTEIMNESYFTPSSTPSTPIMQRKRSRDESDTSDDFQDSVENLFEVKKQKVAK